jgi:hypothetical protein
MAFSPTTFVPRYDQFKLHIEAQIGCGVGQAGDQVRPKPGEADHAAWAYRRKLCQEVQNK